MANIARPSQWSSFSGQHEMPPLRGCEGRRGQLDVPGLPVRAGRPDFQHPSAHPFCVHPSHRPYDFACLPQCRLQSPRRRPHHQKLHRCLRCAAAMRTKNPLIALSLSLSLSRARALSLYLPVCLWHPHPRKRTAQGTAVKNIVEGVRGRAVPEHLRSTFSVAKLPAHNQAQQEKSSAWDPRTYTDCCAVERMCTATVQLQLRVTTCSVQQA